MIKKVAVICIIVSLLIIGSAFFGTGVASMSSSSDPSSSLSPISNVQFSYFPSGVSSLIAGKANILGYPSMYSQVEQALSYNYLNVSSYGGLQSEHLIFFNMFSSQDPGYDIHFRQAIAHIVNYSQEQQNGIISTSSPLLPSAFGSFSSSSTTTYPFSLDQAFVSLAYDPYLMFNATASQPNSNTSIACNGSRGVWESVSTKTPVEPVFVVNQNNNLEAVQAAQIWMNAAKIGLCINLHLVNGIPAAFPIVFERYSNQWAMYLGEINYSAPLDPISQFVSTYTQNQNPFFNTGHYYNSTVESLLHDEISTVSMQRAEQDSQHVVQIISQQLPTLTLWWDEYYVPILTSFSSIYWQGYSSSSLLNVKSNSSSPFVVALPSPVDTFNPFQASTMSDHDVLNTIYDSPMSGSTIAGLVPWMLTQNPVVKGPVNVMTPHGYKIVNGMTIQMTFMDNITFSDNVRMTANDFNFSLWYSNLNGAFQTAPGQCSLPCWMKYVNNTSVAYTGLVPNLVDSFVNSSQTLTIYVNSTSLEDYKNIVTLPVFPEHIWSQIGSIQMFNLNPATETVNGTLLLAGTGPFVFSSSSAGTVSEYRNPGYFRTDISAQKLSGTAGSSFPVSFNLTQQGVPVISNQGIPIPTYSHVVASVFANGNYAGVSSTLVPYEQSWTGQINATTLKIGSGYEIVVNATYTDINGQSHEVLQLWGLSLSSSTTTSTTSSSSSASNSSTTSSSSSMTTTTTSGHPSPPPPFNWPLLIAISALVVVFGGTGAYIAKRRIRK